MVSINYTIVPLLVLHELFTSYTRKLQDRAYRLHTVPLVATVVSVYDKSKAPNINKARKDMTALNAVPIIGT